MAYEPRVFEQEETELSISCVIYWPCDLKFTKKSTSES